MATFTTQSKHATITWETAKTPMGVLLTRDGNPHRYHVDEAQARQAARDVHALRAGCVASSVEVTS